MIAERSWTSLSKVQHLRYEADSYTFDGDDKIPSHTQLSSVTYKKWGLFKPEVRNRAFITHLYAKYYASNAKAEEKRTR